MGSRLTAKLFIQSSETDMWWRLTVSLWLFLITGSRIARGETCAWEACPTWSDDPNVVNLHFVPHTHDDMGWLKTADDYFTGFHPDIVNVAVSEILTNVVTELKKDPQRKFSYCETGFLTRWLESADPQDVADFVHFVNTGQMELIGGGWVQPDEAATHYIDLIDQYTLGFRKLNETFGSKCAVPRTGWQIDPFGHSREHSNLLAMFGHESVYFAREHHVEHDMRKREKKLSFNWFTSDENPDRKLFGGAFYAHYDPPAFMNWDFRVHSHNPIIDNPNLEHYNVDEYRTRLLQFLDEVLKTQSHNHVLLLMGSDFQYTSANMWFVNLDKIIKIANNISEREIRAFYSTPACYTEALKGSKFEWANKTEDFFPYADKLHAYWTGYFTSKPVFKGLVRHTSNLLNSVRQLAALAPLPPPTAPHGPMEILERASALSQHHDGITGTSKDAVTKDYSSRLLEGWRQSEGVWQGALEHLSQRLKQNQVSFPAQTFCRLLNESSCPFTQDNTKKFSVIAFNGLSRTVKTVLRVPIYSSYVAVIDAQGNAIDAAWIVPGSKNGQIVDYSQSPFQLNIPTSLPPNGFSTIFVQAAASLRKKAAFHELTLASPRADSLSNDLLMLQFNDNGYITSLVDKKTGVEYPFTQEFMYYDAAPGVLGQASGAYVFRPTSQKPVDINNFGRVSTEFTKLEARQKFSDYVSQVVRLFPGQRFVEFEWTIGPLPIVKDSFNFDTSLEVITRYRSDQLASNGTLFTDSNGRQTMRRVRGWAPDFPYVNDEPVSGNYYPVTTAAYLQDVSNGLVVLTDRSQAAGSIADGELEFLLHRRDLYDDGYGVDEPLNETDASGRGLVVRGRHWVFLGPQPDAVNFRRQQAPVLFHEPLLSFATFESVQEYSALRQTTFSGLRQPLPVNLHLLTLQQLATDSVLVRVEHVYAQHEDAIWSKPATLDLSTLLNGFSVKHVQELSLGANKIINQNCATSVTLQPQDIRTFLLTVSLN